MKKRLLVLLMALAMCFAMFGCGSQDATEEAAPADEPAAVEEEATPDADAEATPDADADAPADQEADPAAEAPVEE